MVDIVTIQSKIDNRDGGYEMQFVLKPSLPTSICVVVPADDVGSRMLPLLRVGLVVAVTQARNLIWHRESAHALPGRPETQQSLTAEKHKALARALESGIPHLQLGSS